MSGVDWRRKSEGVIVGKERSRRENVEEIRGARAQERSDRAAGNVDDDISPKGTVRQERKFVQLMEHHKSEGETEFLTRAGKL
jgi:hypothetical protein